jgi:hypothetical protein
VAVDGAGEFLDPLADLPETTEQLIGQAPARDAASSGRAGPHRAPPRDNHRP